MLTKPENTRPPCREIFFAGLQVFLSPDDHERVQFAYIASKYGHAKQVRDDGTRYFDHPKGAAWIYLSELKGRDPRLIIDILLHDLSEDAYLLSPFRIGMNFGEDIAHDVRALTKLPKGKETTDQYLNRIVAQGPWAITAKLCDRLHNLRSLRGCAEEKKNAQIEETKNYHLPILISPLRNSHGKHWEQYARALEGKITEVLATY